MKRIIFISLFIITIIIAILLFIVQSLPSNPPTQVFPTPTLFPQRIVPTVGVTSDGKLIVSGVTTNNFIQDAVEKDNAGNYYLVDKPEYQILYMEEFNTFLISILSSPFQKYRFEAESELLNSLGITEEKACKINAEISTPYYANPVESGATYTLSFCDKK